MKQDLFSLEKEEKSIVIYECGSQLNDDNNDNFEKTKITAMIVP